MLIATSLILALSAVGHALSIGTRLAQAWQAVTHGFEVALVHAGFGVQHIYVDGRVRQNANDLRAALAIPKGTPIFAIDLAQAHERVQALPWVKSARISRRLPDMIYVQLRERIPHLLWDTQGQTQLLDKHGVPIDVPLAAEFAHLPRFSGETSAQYALALWNELQKYPSIHVKIVGGIHMAQRRWVLELATGGQIHLPSDQRALSNSLARFAKLQTATQILARKNQDIDLRFADRILLRPAQVHRTAIQDPQWPR